MSGRLRLIIAAFSFLGAIFSLVAYFVLYNQLALSISLLLEI